jgi:TolB-like protein/DNA-binding winged helix-turn-helix (wHTH) protein
MGYASAPAAEPRADETVLRFGTFELHVKSGELLRAGLPVRLQQQPLKVLVLLASRAGQLVTREEIRRNVWGEDTHVDFDQGLNFCVKQIRSALGDQADSPRFIETLPRRGYRFVAIVQRLEPGPTEPAAPHSEAALEAAAQGQGTHDRRPRAAAPQGSFRAGLVAGAAVVAALMGLAGRDRVWPRSQAEPDRAMLVVLPFENLSGDPEQEYLSDGLTEETVTQLSRLEPRRLGVIARTSSMAYKGTRKPVDQIGRELGVDYVLEGSVRRSGDHVRVTAQLVRVSDQTHLWADAYERQAHDLITLQDELAKRVAASLAVQLLPKGRSAPGSLVPETPAH